MDYKATLNLPQTPFPMKANLPQREQECLQFWDDMQLYAALRDTAEGRTRYILHDGPPYANGHIHVGTALNKILKDLIVKTKQMEGFDAVYVPGWDCHGLPIEHQVDLELKKARQQLSKTEIRQQCRAYAERFIDIQREEFKRLGVIGDWQHPYLTMSYAYEAAIVRELGKFLANGAVYRVCLVCHRPRRGGGGVRGASVAVHLRDFSHDLGDRNAIPCLAREAGGSSDLDDDPVDTAGQSGHSVPSRL
jgi:isoleucyl-tRNA synthetase